MAAVLVAALALLALRFAPVIDDVRAVRDDASQLSARARSLGPGDLDRPTLDSLESNLNGLDTDLEPLRQLVTDDPIVAVARSVPIIGTQIRAADDLVAAADSLIEAGTISFGLADQFISLNEANRADPSQPLMPGLVNLMASSGDDVDRIAALVADAQAHVAGIPDDVLGPIRDARDLVAEPLKTYAPLLTDYQTVDGVIPGMLGLGGQKRYLVLAQNAAELRPAGGYSGTVGTITFRDGQLVDQSFVDVNKLDGQAGLPFIKPPPELASNLLGPDQSWRLADAAWSPDFPTSAQRALDFYELETGEGDIDGVIAITTFALDRLLEVIGPVRIPQYDVEIAAGDTTMTLLGKTRGPELTNENRKDILDALASIASRRLLALPPERWPAMLDAATDIGTHHLALAWFVDPEAESLAKQAGWDGSVRTGPGDYLYVVEANMAPTSKYNLVVQRESSLVVGLRPDGGAVNSLRLNWQNDAGKRGEPYRSLREYSNNQDGWYGAYVRALVPAGSDLITASGTASDQIDGAETVGEEAGRAVFGNYLLMPPGPSTLTYLWTVPDAVVQTETGWEYRLDVQKQPGARAEHLSVRVDLPPGAHVTEVSDGAVVEGGRVVLDTTLTTDLELLVRYTLEPVAAG